MNTVVYYSIPDNYGCLIHEPQFHILYSISKNLKYLEIIKILSLSLSLSLSLRVPQFIHSTSGLSYPHFQNPQDFYPLPFFCRRNPQDFYPLHFFRSPESLRWPIAMGWRPSSCGVRRPLTSSSQELLGQS